MTDHWKQRVTHFNLFTDGDVPVPSLNSLLFVSHTHTHMPASPGTRYLDSARRAGLCVKYASKRYEWIARVSAF